MSDNPFVPTTRIIFALCLIFGLTRPLRADLCELYGQLAMPRFARSFAISASLQNKEQLEDSAIFRDQLALRIAVENSLKYLLSTEAQFDYQSKHSSFPWAKVLRSVTRFRELLNDSQSSAEFHCRIAREFDLRPVAGSDEQQVRFTGYFQPLYQASKQRTAEFRFPIYRTPSDFHNWPKPHPSRIELEGYDGSPGKYSALRGLELAWFRSRYEAFMVGLQGSAVLQMTDGSQLAVGFAAGLDHPFVGISSKFLRDHKVSYTKLREFFDAHPELLNQYLARNNRLIFFKPNLQNAPIGSLGVPVVAERSIATDKQRMPPGAIALIRTSFPVQRSNGKIVLERGSRFVADQDAGSAIKGPGRVDLFMGTGKEAQRKASFLYAPGEIAYLLLKN